MPSIDIVKYWPIVTLFLSMIVGGAVANEQIGELKDKVKKLELSNEQQIRIEERQKINTETLQNTSVKLDQVLNLLMQQGVQ